jgi:hypothetical protein
VLGSVNVVGAGTTGIRDARTGAAARRLIALLVLWGNPVDLESLSRDLGLAESDRAALGRQLRDGRAELKVALGDSAHLINWSRGRIQVDESLVRRSDLRRLREAAKDRRWERVNELLAVAPDEGRWPFRDVAPFAFAEPRTSLSTLIAEACVQVEGIRDAARRGQTPSAVRASPVDADSVLGPTRPMAGSLGAGSWGADPDSPPSSPPRTGRSHARKSVPFVSLAIAVGAVVVTVFILGFAGPRRPAVVSPRTAAVVPRPAIRVVAASLAKLGAVHGPLSRAGGASASVHLTGGGGNTLSPVAQLEGDHPRTIAIRFRTNASGRQTLLSAGRQRTAESFLFAIADAAANQRAPYAAAGLYLQLLDDDVLVPVTVADGAWHDAAVSLNGQRVLIAIDGRLPPAGVWDGTRWTNKLRPQPAQIPDPPQTASTPVRIGSGPPGAAWGPGLRGDVAVVDIWARALSSAQLQKLTTTLQ